MNGRRSESRRDESNAATGALEARVFLSIALENGTLTVLGTPEADYIAVYLDLGKGLRQYQVILSPLGRPGADQRGQFPETEVRAVVVRAGGGDDLVDFGTESLVYGGLRPPPIYPIRVPGRVDAGIGADEVIGGAKQDYLFGGFGKDRIRGGSGGDWIDGGWGDDFLSGGYGNDYVSGGRGNDYVHGDGGDDRLYGGPGNDHVGFNSTSVGARISEPGDDVLVGGPGEDWLFGGLGTDRIYGGFGRDHWSAEDDDSEMLDRTPDEPKDVPQGV